ncbi:MAG TPA: MotA/TolQ/ExbB proton channel family protein [Candidatus Eisenbacteria bacterium]|nr:MotA/TolQ/ExbB proton channel family protein [Candidatus Eisenbacteria bacterium]
MNKRAAKCPWVYSAAVLALLSGAPAHAAAAAAARPGDKEMTFLQLIASGGVCIYFLGVLSVVVVAVVIYHFLNVRVEKLIPQDMTENLLSLIERKEYDKALSVCRQQPNLISAIVEKGLQKAAKGKGIVEEAIQYEGKARIERLWQNLTYLGDMAVIAPMIGLLGTILGMIDAFNYFKLGTLNPAVLTQGLAKAMINTAFGLVIAVPALIAYSYFRGRVSRITTTAEALSSEIARVLAR